MLNQQCLNNCSDPFYICQLIQHKHTLGIDKGKIDKNVMVPVFKTPTDILSRLLEFMYFNGRRSVVTESTNVISSRAAGRSLCRNVRFRVNAFKCRVYRTRQRTPNYYSI